MADLTLSEILKLKYNMRISAVTRNGEIDGHPINDFVPVNGWIDPGKILVITPFVDSFVPKPVFWSSAWDEAFIEMCSFPPQCREMESPKTCVRERGSYDGSYQ